jgi:ureidoacrylate peracid hydrolase
MKIDKNIHRRSFILTGLAAIPFFRANRRASHSKPKRINSMADHLFRDTKSRVIRLDAKPEPIAIDTARTAVIVVDMQNDFGSKGGLLDRLGMSIAEIRAVIPPTSRVLAAARSAGISIVYLKMAYRPDLSDLGASDAPNRIGHLQAGVGKTVAAPNGVPSRILIRDTWNTEILDELQPKPGDVVLYKNRFSGFHQTGLDDVLKKKGIRRLIFTGCTTSVCVESTVRDAVFLDYAPVVLADCTAEPAGFEMNHKATLTLIEKRLFGSVSNSDEFIRALK